MTYPFYFLFTEDCEYGEGFYCRRCRISADRNEFELTLRCPLCNISAEDMGDPREYD